MHIFKKLLICVFITLVTISVSLSAAAESRLLAFPGAEGGGKYSLGARGILDEGGSIEVYHVTNLADSGAGSLRDAVSKPGRIVVFDVSGAINLNSQLTIKSNNLTILGQTAPGDGVTIIGGDVITDDGIKNIIIRYLKVRPTDKNGGEPDGIGGRFGTNIIFDHVSTSWCVDELLTLYSGPVSLSSDDKPVGNHLTIQNTIGSESLRMSNHVKGAHGYGAIWGGTNASYVYNLLAHHDSRSPRMDRELQVTEVSHNVIYDWGQTNSAYGAEPYDTGKTSKRGSYINWINNYYKAGPATAKKILTRVFDVTSPLSSDDKKSAFFFSNNYIYGTGTITDYKNDSYVNNYSGAEILENEINMGDYKTSEMSAEEAYQYVLNNAGATLPRRDATDARIINDVKNGTGRLVNNASEVGGLIPIDEEHRTFEIPQEWLTANGFDGKNETDIIESGDFAGYTVIEAYVNNWTEEQSKTPPTNPNIVVHSPAISSLTDTIEGLPVDNGEWTVITEDETVNYKATAIAVGDNEVTKIELYDGNTKIGEYAGSQIDAAVSLNAGTHYLTSRATNMRGEKTQSTTSIVYVKAASAPGSYSYAEVRESKYTGYKGKGGASMDENGVYTVYGSGRITTKANDSCGFMYKSVNGDFDITAKIESIPKFENQQVNGLMVRTGLASDDVMAMIGDGWIKHGENVRVFSRKTKKENISEQFFKDKDGQNCENDDNKKSFTVPKYMRIQRSGNTLTFSVSNSGVVWNDTLREPMSIEFNNLPDTLFVGIATDSANGVSVKECFSTAKFSHLTLNGESDVTLEEGKVPFFDTSFDPSENPEWYIPNGSGNKTFESGLGGNYGDIMLFWGETYRSFNPQKRGVITASADFYTRKHASNTGVNNNAGARFMLNGTDENGNIVKIKSVYAQNKKGFFDDHDDTAVPVPSSAPNSANAYKLDTWYKVEMQLDYNTGKGTFSFKPYTEYNSLTETYAVGDSIYDSEFNFDTGIAVSQLHFQRYAGWEMYLDNVAIDVSGTEYFIIDGTTVKVNNPETNAVLYIAEYSNDDVLINCDLYNVDAHTVSDSFNLPSKGNKTVLYLWDENNSPLCKPIEL